MYIGLLILHSEYFLSLIRPWFIGVLIGVFPFTLRFLISKCGFLLEIGD